MEDLKILFRRILLTKQAIQILEEEVREKEAARVGAPEEKVSAPSCRT